MATLTMPTLGADMDSGTLLEWRIAPGDHVHRGDIVATIDTDKAEIDIETFDDGVVEELLVEPGTRVDVGVALARIADGAAAPPAAAPEPAVPPAPSPAAEAPSAAAPPATSPAAEAPPAAAPPATPPPAPAGAPRRRVSPLARRIAQALGVDLGAVTGTGPHGAITRVDVERAAAPEAPAGAPGRPPAPPPATGEAPGPARRSPQDRSRSLARAVGDLMARSKREIPHYHLARDIDLTAALGWLDARNAGRPAHERLLPAALLLRAVALAAHDVPEMNGTYAEGGFRPAAHVDLGVAVSLRGGGIIAPAIPGADGLTLPQLMEALHGCTTRARRGGLQRADLAGATLTVTSLGDHGADLVHGVIFPPQVALVGFGRIGWRPWAVDGLLGARRAVTATLAGDHRVSDGHHGSLFLASVDHHLQEPDAL